MGEGGRLTPLFLSLYHIHEPIIKTTRTKYKIIHQHIFDYNNCYIIYLYHISMKKQKVGACNSYKKYEKQNGVTLFEIFHHTHNTWMPCHCFLRNITYSPFLISATISFLTFACSLHLVSLFDQSLYSQGLAGSIALSHDNPCEIIATCLL